MSEQFKKYMLLEKEKVDDGLCGAWPFVLPRRFGLTSACTKHDNGYLILRYHALQAYQNAKSKERVAKSLEQDYWKGLVAKQDVRFKKWLRGLVLKKSPWKRPLYRLAEEAMYRIVKTFGWRIWKEGTLREWEKMMSL